MHFVSSKAAGLTIIVGDKYRNHYFAPSAIATFRWASLVKTH